MTTNPHPRALKKWLAGMKKTGRWAEAMDLLLPERNQPEPGRRLTPTPWARRDLIAALYCLARAYTRAGISAHVDHVLPLKGQRVSGLHVETNLTVLPALANLQKSNRFIAT